MLTNEGSMISVEKRGDIHHDIAQTMETLSQIFHLRTSLICSSEEVTQHVSVLCIYTKLVKQYCHFHWL